MTQTGHLSELHLRRLFAGEPLDPARLQHSHSCDECKSRLKGLGEEHRRFEQAIPFERFAAGVERASRTPRPLPPVHRWPKVVLAVAASLVAIATVPVLLNRGHDERGNRIKGGSAIDVVIAGAGGQRLAPSDPQVAEPLSPAERVRIGYRPGSHRYLIAVSIDEAGAVSPLYGQAERSLAVDTSAASTAYLPDSFELTGSGLERLVVVLSDEPLSFEEVRKAAQARYEEARGNLLQLGSLDLSGEQFHRTFRKP